MGVLPIKIQDNYSITRYARLWSGEINSLHRRPPGSVSRRATSALAHGCEHWPARVAVSVPPFADTASQRLPRFDPESSSLGCPFKHIDYEIRLHVRVGCAAASVLDRKS